MTTIKCGDTPQEAAGQKFSFHFLMAEWADVVDAWQLETWVEAARLSYKVLDENVETTPGHVSVSTMRLAKGLVHYGVDVARVRSNDFSR